MLPYLHAGKSGSRFFVDRHNRERICQFLASTIQTTLLGIDRFQAALYHIEGIAYGNIEIFVFVFVVLFVRDDDIVIGDEGFYPYVVDLAFMMVVMGRFEGDSQTLDLITETFQLFYSFVYRLLN